MSTTQETLKSLLEIGESKGFVTFQQVFNAVTKEKSDPERLDKLLTLLEDVEDAAEVQRLRVLKEQAIPWGQAKQELKDKDIHV